MKMPYREGSWFAVPLRRGGFAVGLVARASPKGKVVLCYFFGPRYESVPELPTTAMLRPEDAIGVVLVGDLALVRGTWPIVGQSSPWNRSEWRVPPFLRRDELSRKAWRVLRSDTDPAIVVSEEPEPFDSTLKPDGLFGAGAAETMLTKLLA